MFFKINLSKFQIWYYKRYEILPTAKRSRPRKYKKWFYKITTSLIIVIYFLLLLYLLNEVFFEHWFKKLFY